MAGDRGPLTHSMRTSSVVVVADAVGGRFLGRPAGSQVDTLDYRNRGLHRRVDLAEVGNSPVSLNVKSKVWFSRI